MAALPGTEWGDERQFVAAPLAQLRHMFTHVTLELTVCEDCRAEGPGWWHPIDRLHDAGLPTLYRRAGDLVREGRSIRAAAA